LRLDTSFEAEGPDTAFEEVPTDHSSYQKGLLDSAAQRLFPLSGHSGAAQPNKPFSVN
jgi:hypothetical protein